MTDRAIGSAGDLDALDFGSDGLLPVVVSDAATGEALMVAFANRPALERSLATGQMHFWSRRRSQLWRKGETSGNTLALVSLHADCDADTVLARVMPAGPTCHTGERTCFGEGAGAPVAALARLDRTLAARQQERPSGSYTVKRGGGGPRLPRPGGAAGGRGGRERPARGAGPPGMSGDATFHDEEALGKAYDARLMRRLLQYLRPYWRQVGLALLVLLLAAGTNIVGPWLTQLVIDEAIPSGDANLLGLLALAFLGTVIVGFALEYVEALVTTWLGQSVMYDLRKEIFAKLQRADLKFYDKTPIGRLMTRITNDVETLNELFSSGVVTVFGDLFTLVFILAAMLGMNWRLALVTFSVLPLVFITVFVFRAKIRDAYREIRVRLARVNAFMHERFTGIRVVQLFNRERADAAKLGELNDDHLQAHLRSITYYALFFPLMEFFTALALALIVWFGGVRSLEGTITVGVIAAFLQYARRFFQPIQDLSEKYNLLQSAMASSERVFKLLDHEVAVVDPVGPRPPTEPTLGHIRFEHVWFAYGADETGEPHWVLRDVSLEVRPGEKVAIVGHTGAGKTTLINLLMRFYDPSRGRILLDGVPIHELRLEDLRTRIGLVLQDVFLFSEDVGYNIRLGSDAIDSDRVRAAAERVGAATFIDRLPRGFDQPLGERGATLSVGERQLVSFARALAFDPAILVLDEATSSVDSEIEAQIETATDELLAGRTSLVIAHRLSTVQNADRIVVLHHGEVREQGSHEELLAAGGLYARLHELQFVPAEGVR
jgi:ATP-binding cassette subfamily B protein